MLYKQFTPMYEFTSGLVRCEEENFIINSIMIRMRESNYIEIESRTGNCDTTINGNLFLLNLISIRANLIDMM